jgi:sarcosine oxidase subunit beta
MSSAVHVYVSQSDKGELVMGAGIDGYNSYAQTGSPPVVERSAQRADRALPDLQPAARARTWGGIVDVCPMPADHQQDAGGGLYFNCGWGTGGSGDAGLRLGLRPYHRAGPAPKLNEPFALDRFVNGYLIDEHGAAGVAH